MSHHTKYLFTLIILSAQVITLPTFASRASQSHSHQMATYCNRYSEINLSTSEEEKLVPVIIAKNLFCLSPQLIKNNKIIKADESQKESSTHPGDSDPKMNENFAYPWQGRIIHVSSRFQGFCDPEGGGKCTDREFQEGLGYSASLRLSEAGQGEMSILESYLKTYLQVFNKKVPGTYNASLSSQGPLPSSSQISEPRIQFSSKPASLYNQQRQSPLALQNRGQNLGQEQACQTQDGSIGKIVNYLTFLSFRSPVENTWFCSSYKTLSVEIERALSDQLSKL